MATFIKIVLFILIFILVLPSKASYHKALTKLIKQHNPIFPDYTDLQNCFARNADIEEIKDDATPLMKAVNFFLIGLLTGDVICYLIKKGANPNHHGDLISPLMAASSPRAIITSFLNVSNNSFPAYCSEMTYQKSQWLIELLIKNETNIDWQNISGQTALHLAAAEGNLLGIETLLKLGANAQIKNMSGKTALDVLEEIQTDSEIISANSFLNSPIKIISDLKKNPVYQQLKKKTFEKGNKQWKK